MRNLLLFLALVSFPAHARTPSYSEAELKSAASTFRLKGNWISPRIVKDFLPWPSDSGKPMILSLDVAQAAGSNRYFGETTLQGPDKKWPTFTEGEGENKGESISYDYIGRLKNGMHVLVTYEYGSGTMVSTDLLVFSLAPAKAKDQDGKDYQRLILNLERMVILGDRAKPTIKLDGNTIHAKTANDLPHTKPGEKTIRF